MAGQVVWCIRSSERNILKCTSPTKNTNKKSWKQFNKKHAFFKMDTLSRFFKQNIINKLHRCDESNELFIQRHLLQPAQLASAWIRCAYILYIYIYVLVPGPSTPPPQWYGPGPTPPQGGGNHSIDTLGTPYIHSIYNLYWLYTSLYTYYILFPFPHNIPPPQGGGGYQDHWGWGRGGGRYWCIYIYIYITAV